MSSGPSSDAKSTINSGELDFDYFVFHSNVYNKIKPNPALAVKPTAGLVNQNPNINKATEIIEEYKAFLTKYTTFNQTNPSQPIEFNTKVTNDIKNKPELYDIKFFQLVQSIINSYPKITDDSAVKIIDQSKIIITVIDSFLLNALINKKDSSNNIDESINESFSAIDKSPFEDLVMNSIPTDLFSIEGSNTDEDANKQLINKEIMVSSIATMLSGIQNEIENMDFTKQDSKQSYIEASKPTMSNIELIEKSIKESFTKVINYQDMVNTAITGAPAGVKQIRLSKSKLSGSIQSDKSDQPIQFNLINPIDSIDTLLELLNQIVIISSMNSSIKTNIIDKFYPRAVTPEPVVTPAPNDGTSKLQVKPIVATKIERKPGHFIVVGTLDCADEKYTIPDLSKITHVYISNDEFVNDKFKLNIMRGGVVTTRAAAAAAKRVTPTKQTTPAAKRVTPAKQTTPAAKQTTPPAPVVVDSTVSKPKYLTYDGPFTEPDLYDNMNTQLELDNCTTPNHFILVGNLYCIDGIVIPPNFSDIIHIYKGNDEFDPNDITVTPNKVYAINEKSIDETIKTIRTEIIDKYCESGETTFKGKKQIEDDKIAKAETHAATKQKRNDDETALQLKIQKDAENNAIKKYIIALANYSEEALKPADNPIVKFFKDPILDTIKCNKFDRIIYTDCTTKNELNEEILQLFKTEINKFNLLKYNNKPINIIIYSPGKTISNMNDTSLQNLDEPTKQFINGLESHTRSINSKCGRDPDTGKKIKEPINLNTTGILTQLLFLNLFITKKLITKRGLKDNTYAINTNENTNQITQNNIPSRLDPFQSPPTVVKSQPTVVESPPTVVESPPTVIESPPTVVESPPTVIESPPAVVKSPPTVVKSQPTVVKSPPEVVNPPPEVVNPQNNKKTGNKTRKIFKKIRV